MTEIKRENRETADAIVKTFEKVRQSLVSSNTWTPRSGSTADPLKPLMPLMQKNHFFFFFGSLPKYTSAWILSPPRFDFSLPCRLKLVR